MSSPQFQNLLSWLNAWAASGSLHAPGRLSPGPAPQSGSMHFNPFARLNPSQITDLRHNPNMMYFLHSARQNDPIYQAALRRGDFMVALNILRNQHGLPSLPPGGAFYPGTHTPQPRPVPQQ